MQLLEGYFETLFDPKEPWKKKAWDRFLEIGMPKPKQEAFQYLPLKDLVIPEPASPPKTEKASPNTLLFVDGFFQGADLPKPLVCLKMDAAMLVYGVFLQNRTNRSIREETDPFALMNGAFQGKGAFLYVPPNTHVKEPIEIHHRISGEAMVSPRLQISLGKGASVKICSRGAKNGAFSNAYIDIGLDEGASLFFGDSLEGPSTFFQSLRCTLKKESRLHYSAVTNGAKLGRSSVKVQLVEENAEALLQGLSVLDGVSQMHTHVQVEHIARSCRSRQHFKSLLRGKSRSSFEGKIFVRPEGQKTEAYQLSNTLLLSKEAMSYAKPNLEIFADDVKASHGATVSQMSDEELFYFRTRGIPLQTAQEILSNGFCNEILNALPAGIKL